MVRISVTLVVHMLLINRVLVACLISLCLFKHSTMETKFILPITHTFSISFVTLLKFLH